VKSISSVAPFAEDRAPEEMRRSRRVAAALATLCSNPNRSDNPADWDRASMRALWDDVRGEQTCALSSAPAGM